MCKLINRIISKLKNLVRGVKAGCSSNTGVRNSLRITLPIDTIAQVLGVHTSKSERRRPMDAKHNKHGYWLTSEGKPSHFCFAETRCKCGCNENRVNQILLDKVEELRLRINKPLLILSWYRCESHNKRVGGALLSGHLIGEAVDFFCPHLQLSQLWLFCERNSFDGLGAYPESKPPIIHADILERYSRWCYRHGKYWYLF